MPVRLARKQTLQDLNALFLPVDALLQRPKRNLVGLLAELLQHRLQMVEIGNVLDRGACDGHMPVEHVGRVVARQSDPCDEKYERNDEEQDLGNDPAALKNSIDK